MQLVTPAFRVTQDADAVVVHVACSGSQVSTSSIGLSLSRRRVVRGLLPMRTRLAVMQIPYTYRT